MQLGFVEQDQIVGAKQISHERIVRHPGGHRMDQRRQIVGGERISLIKAGLGREGPARSDLAFQQGNFAIA